MPDIYVRSTDGDDADNGSTWALAKATIPTTIEAGDRVILSQAHAQTQATALTITSNGTPANPVVIACGNDAAEPPTSAATSAEINVTGGVAITLAGTFIADGLKIINGFGSTASSAKINLSTGSEKVQTYRNCIFNELSTGLTAGVFIGSNGTAPPQINWDNCSVSFAGTGLAITVLGGKFTWSGGSVLSGSSTPSLSLIACTSISEGVDLIVSGVDLSNFASTLTLINITGESGRAAFRNCKLPASWSGGLVASGMGYGCRVEMHNCDSGDTNYRLWVEDFCGTIKSETTWVRTGGASDGTTDYSWRMVSSSDASEHFPLWSPEIAIWNDTVGSSVTVTVEILHDSATALQDDEVWLEVQYLGTSGYPLGSFVSDKRASLFATPADQASSSETWTTTGMSNPNTQKLSVTFTPQEVGYLHARVALGKASYTLIVDPMLTVS